MEKIRAVLRATRDRKGRLVFTLEDSTVFIADRNGFTPAEGEMWLVEFWTPEGKRYRVCRLLKRMEELELCGLRGYRIAWEEE
jgi:hypothetical protein